MALGEAWLTPHRHSLAASPVCSPGAASRRVLHTSSHSKGCRLEDRKRCALSPPWMQKALSPVLGLYSQGTGRKRAVSQATISTQSRHPLGQTHSTSQLDLATDRASLRHLARPQVCLHTACLLTWYQCINDMDLFPNWNLYLHNAIPILSIIVTIPMLTIKAIYFYCGKYKNNEKTTLKKSCIVFPIFFLCVIFIQLELWLMWNFSAFWHIHFHMVLNGFWHISRQKYNSERYMHPFVHSSTIYNSQVIETIQMSIYG